MRIIKILCLFFLFIQINYYPQVKFYQVITQNEINSLSIIKLSDIFQLLPQVDLYSIDGYRFNPNPGRDLTNSKDDIHFFINGTKVFFGLSEIFNINHLPIHQEQIDSVIVLTGSTFYGNEYLQGIVIDFILKKNQKEYEFIFTHSSGNEVGDPGPYSFTEFTSENVDQVGPNTQAFFGYRKKNLSLNINYLDRVFPATDSKILARVPQFVFENYQVRFFGASLDLSANSSLGEHYLFTSFTKTGKAVTGFIYGADLMFMENFSKNVPIETSSLSFNSGNIIHLSSHSRLKIELNSGRNLFANSKFVSFPSFNNNETWFTTKFIFHHSFNKFRFHSGLQYLFNDIKDTPSAFQITNNQLSFNLGIDYQPIEKFNQRFSLSLHKLSPSLIFQLQIYNKYDFQKSSLSFEISSGRKPTLFSNILIPCETETPFDFNYHQEFHKINLAYQYKPKNDYQANIDFTIERENNLHLRLLSFRHYNMVNVLLRSFVFEEKGVNTTKGQISLSLQHKITNKLSHRFIMVLTSILSNNNLAEAFYNRIPLYRLNYLISFSSSKDFILSASISYQEETEWSEYNAINNQINPIKAPIYSDKLDNGVLLNVSAKKSFWGDKVRINASIYNLLNNDIQYHPLGSVMKLIFYLKGELAI